MHRDDPGDLDVRQGLSVSWDKLYYFSIGKADFAGAAKAAEASLAIAELLGTIDPDNDDWARQLVVARERPARLAYEADDGKTAVAKQERALEIAERRVARAPANTNALEGLADTLSHYGDYLTLAKQPDRAIEVLRRAQKIMEGLSTKQPGNFDYKRGNATLHEYIATVFFQLAEYRAATDEYRARMALDEELLKADPGNPRRAIDLASTQFLTGISTTYLAGRRDEGLALARTALATFKQLDKDGKLSPDMQSTLAEREKLIAERAK
jgi:tetratricopeptide (TPR) repeat protein